MYEMVAPEDETQPRNRLGHSKWMARLDPPFPPHHSLN
jgi:hypothetical protein